MNIEIKRIIKTVSGNDGKNYNLRLEIPFFSEEDGEGKKLNVFYENFAKKLEENAMKNSCTIISELHKAFCGEDFFSLYIDILWYRGRELLACRRVSDTRRAGYEIRPPKGLKKLSNKRGWYYNGKDCVFYENNFTLGAEKNIRRSEYYKFFSETKYKIEIKRLNNIV